MKLNHREQLSLAITALIASTVTLVIAIVVFYVPNIAAPINVGHYYTTTPEEVQIENQINLTSQEFNVDINAYALGFSDQNDISTVDTDIEATENISIPTSNDTNINIDEVNNLYN